MNEIYWQDKRTMNPKQLSSPGSAPPTQPRRMYESRYQTKAYAPTDTRVTSHSTSSRAGTSPPLHYPTVAHRSYHHQQQQQQDDAHFPYTSSLHGVYRRSPPTVITSQSRLHTNETRRIDLRNQFPHPQQRPLARSASEDYYSSKYHDSNGYSGEIYDDEDDDEEELRSGMIRYTYNDPGVSSHLLSHSLFPLPQLDAVR